jgi:hypothetical protein
MSRGKKAQLAAPRVSHELKMMHQVSEEESEELASFFDLEYPWEDPAFEGLDDDFYSGDQSIS